MARRQTLRRKNTSVALDELEKQSILEPFKFFFFFVLFFSSYSLKVCGKEKLEMAVISGHTVNARQNNLE